MDGSGPFWPISSHWMMNGMGSKLIEACSVDLVRRREMNGFVEVGSTPWRLWFMEGYRVSYWRAVKEVLPISYYPSWEFALDDASDECVCVSYRREVFLSLQKVQRRTTKDGILILTASVNGAENGMHPFILQRWAFVWIIEILVEDKIFIACFTTLLLLSWVDGEKASCGLMQGCVHNDAQHGCQIQYRQCVNGEQLERLMEVPVGWFIFISTCLREVVSEIWKFISATLEIAWCMSTDINQELFLVRMRNNISSLRMLES